MNDYTSLDVWKESVALAKAVYELTAKFPVGERYGLASQMRRAAVSVASNIAEGAGRNSNADFCRFLDMATGSVSELHTQFVIATEVRILPTLRVVSEDCPAEDLTERMTRIRKMLAGLRRSLKG